MGDIVAATGHRPDKLGGYYRDAEKKVVQTAIKSLELLEPESVITGMALGWDLAIARAAYELGIPFTAAVPFKGQESRWNAATQNYYFRLLRKAAAIFYVSEPGYAPSKMEIRNRWMVDNADRILALYNGDPGGGTANCIRYSMSVNRPIFNAWRLYTDKSECLTEMVYNPE